MPSSRKRAHGKPNAKQAQGKNTQQPRPRYKPFGLAAEQLQMPPGDDSTPEDVQMQVIRLAYERVMLEIKHRMDSIRLLQTGKFTNPSPALNTETVALNFRKIAELILFATLIGHEEEYSALYDSIDEEWRIGQIISRVKEINPLYYPTPTLQTGERDENGLLGFQPLPEGTWLTEDELRAMYSQCSNLIHARNPYKPRINYEDFNAKFLAWYNKIYQLLRHHTVVMPGRKYLINCILSTKPNGNPRASVLADVSDSHPEFHVVDNKIVRRESVASEELAAVNTDVSDE